MVTVTPPPVDSSVSSKQLHANRANAQKSTGPKTEPGRAASSQNARKHGIFCKDLVLPGEDAQAFGWLKCDILRTLNPANAMELALVEQIIANEWRIKRVRTNEANLAAAGNPEDQKQLERYQAYEMRLRGSVFRCLSELRTLRKGDVTKETDLTQLVVTDDPPTAEVRDEPTATPTALPTIGYDEPASSDPENASKPTPRARLAMAVNKTVQDLESSPMLRKAG